MDHLGPPLTVWTLDAALSLCREQMALILRQITCIETDTKAVVDDQNNNSNDKSSENGQSCSRDTIIRFQRLRQLFPVNKTPAEKMLDSEELTTEDKQ